ncbi:glucose dehydrogenase [FAD, quinone]-like [Condylostylus longicornis]|uniref:glucose dehydrogenase [FAD, quinone]-like n=1 Tax=Condylostylus longicornis TaxID=2530218 RepID=UPI00244DE546|nr:glucose dehydrogenase [FAD, quinone]-like [Condylostylus longicornis]XP_055384810.1 glucose dehydrogenase [FAD, quinone]-like [Condylostylus longicornis]
MELLSSQCAAQSAGPGNQFITLLIQTLISSYCNVSSPENWPQDYGSQVLENNIDLDFDFVVVGAGSAGSVVASRLSENPNNRVLVLEAGGDPPFESEIPYWFFLLQHSGYDWQYYTEPNEKSCQGQKTKTCYWPRGKLLGGSGAINAMISIRGNRKDFDKWEEAGNPTWGFDDLLPYFMKTEKTYADAFLDVTERGTDGPQPVSKFSAATPNIEIAADMVIEAAQELGLKYINDYSENNGYIGFFKAFTTYYQRRRFSTAKSFLLPASKQPNLKVIKHAHVEKINFDENKKVKSIDFVYKSAHKMTVNINKEAVLSAGTIGTPQILQLSGIGLEKDLKKVSIPVVQNLNVGRNLQDHVIVPVHFKIHKSTALPFDQRIILDELYGVLTGKSTLLSQVGLAGLCGFINTKSQNGPYPDIEYHYFLFAKQDELGIRTLFNIIGYKDEIINSVVEENKEGEILIVWAVLLNPESRGKVVITSPEYTDKPKIYANYFDKNSDLETIINGIKFQTKFLNTKSFKNNEAELIKINLPECDKYDFQSDKYWKCYVKQMSSTVYHPVGTAKMGPKEDKKAVVDPELKVHGVDGLRVCDASIMPFVVSANTNAATIMIGEKCSDFIKKTYDSSIKDEF